MPRIENNGENVEEWCEKTGNGSSTHDVCATCYKKVAKNPHQDLDCYNGDPVGTDGWGGDVDHPPYEEEDYKCEICGKRLTSKDNGGI